MRPELENGEINFFPWATEYRIRPESIKNQILLLENKKVPRSEHTTHGLGYNEPINSAEINYILDGAHQWYRYIADIFQVGSIKETTTDETEEEISQRMGGTWQLLGTDTVGGETIKVFKKISEDRYPEGGL